jgi:hypothetical protein
VVSAHACLLPRLQFLPLWGPLLEEQRIALAHADKDRRITEFIDTGAAPESGAGNLPEVGQNRTHSKTEEIPLKAGSLWVHVRL